VDDTRDRLVRKGDYVYGSFLKPESVDGYINAINPGDRTDVLGRFPFSESSVDSALEVAAGGSRSWRRLAINDRCTAIRRFRDSVSRYQERLARLITRETGKALWESRQEVLAAIRAVDLFLDEGLGLLQPRVIEEIGARSDRLPRGVVGVLCPYTFPVLNPVTHVVAALLGGNAVLVKPSKFTPGVGQFLAEMWDRCRLPRGVFNMVQGPGSVVGQRMVLHPGLDALVFTGSYPTAGAIRQITIERPELPMVLQCGGKGVALVLDDAELERAVYEVVIGAFLTSGQRHNSTGRVIVTEAIYDRFVNELVRHSSRLAVGYGFDADVFMGPLISENLRARYRRYGRALVSKGHTPLYEGLADRSDRRGFYVRPAIYQVNWDNGQPFLAEEPPGPTLLVYKVSNWEQAAALHNQCAFRSSTSVFCRPESPVLGELRDRLRTGGLNVNRGTIGASLRLSSTGLGRASNGVGGGLDLVLSLTHARAQLVESRPFAGSPVLPGTNWNEPERVEPEVEVEDTDEDDLSSSLELAVE
jgi:succinylglutamic semialdehyde dehydrogenase